MKDNGLVMSPLGMVYGVLAGGDPAFNPVSLSDLKWLLETDTLSGLSDGDPVSTLTDNSPAGNSFTGTTTTRPLYKTGIQNSKPSLLFDGTDDLLTRSYDLGGSPQIDLWVVFKPLSATPAFQMFFVMDATAFELRGNNGGNGLEWNSNGVLLTYNTTIVNAPLIVNVYSDTVNDVAKMFVNGVERASTSSFTGNIGQSRTARIGCRSAGSLHSNFHFFASACFGQIQSSTVRAQMNTYFNQKWAVY